MRLKDFRYRIIATATDGEHEGQYEFEEMYDDVTDETVSHMFYTEFGTRPTDITIIHRERIN